MNLRRGDVHEVVSFYSYLQVAPAMPRVCTGPVCDCLGARADGALAVPCLGHCDLAPVRLEGEAVVGGVAHRTNGFLAEPDRPGESPELPPERVLAGLKA